MKTSFVMTDDEKLIYVTLGARIASKRAAKGITQADLAEEMGMSRANLANIEAGRQGVLVHVAIKIAQRLKMKLVET